MPTMQGQIDTVGIKKVSHQGRVAGRDPSSLQRWILAITSSASRSLQLPKVNFILSHFPLFLTIGVRRATGLSLQRHLTHDL